MSLLFIDILSKFPTNIYLLFKLTTISQNIILEKLEYWLVKADFAMGGFG